MNSNTDLQQSNNQSNGALLQLIKTIENITTEFIKLAQFVPKLSDEHKDIEQSADEIIKALTDDENGIRKLIKDILSDKDYNNKLKLEKAKSLLNLRNALILVLSNAVTAAVVYLIFGMKP